jgi:hypothetical protein
VASSAAIGAHDQSTGLAKGERYSLFFFPLLSLLNHGYSYQRSAGSRVRGGKREKKADTFQILSGEEDRAEVIVFDE